VTPCACRRGFPDAETIIVIVCRVRLLFEHKPSLTVCRLVAAPARAQKYHVLPIAIFRLYGPLEPWFDKTWKPGDIELVQ
jgi:hypothetical protein